MAEDVHRSWIAECRARLPDLDTSGIRALLRDAQAARQRAESAGDPRGVAPLYSGLIDDLGNRLTQIELESRLENLDDPTLVQLLSHPLPEVRLRALQAAVDRGLESGADRIAAHLQVEGDPFVVATAVKALGELGGPTQVPVLLGYLRHEDPRVRANAVEGLVLAGAAPEYLLRAAEDVDHRVRSNAAVGLLDSRPEDARRVLLGLALDPSEAARKSGLDLLVRVDPLESLEFLQELLDRGGLPVAGPVFALLAKSPDPRVVRVVLDAMEDEARPLGVRTLAMQAAETLRRGAGEEDWGDLLGDAVEAFRLRLRESDGPRSPVSTRVPAEDEPAGDEDPEEEASGPASGARRPTAAEQMRAKAQRWVTVIGRVVDSADRNPVWQAQVRIPSMGILEYTDRKGQFTVERLERGKVYVFVVEKQGYPPRTTRYRCSGKKEQVLRINLVGRRA